MRPQIIHPDVRLGVDFDESGGGIYQLENVESVDDAFELRGVNTQTLFPGPQRRFARFARRRFMQYAQESSARLRLRHNLIENAREVPMNLPTHQLVNVKALAVQETSERSFAFARRLQHRVDKERTRTELLHN